MTKAQAGVIAIGAALVAACSRHAATTVAPDRSLAAQDSAAEELARGARARRDSVDAARRSAMLAAADRQRQHDDSVRNQVQGEMGMESAGLRSWGLAAWDSVAIAGHLQFDFDRADLSETDVTSLEAKRQVLATHGDLEIRIEGNADERGSDEYNLALGLRRAAAAKRWLVEHGIGADRISIVSNGEEHPVDPGHDEAAWARNRCDTFVVTRASSR